MKALLLFLSGVGMLSVFLIAIGYIAYVLGRKWFAGRSLDIRLCASCILFCWFLCILFSILMSVRMFAPLPATSAALIGVVVVSRMRARPKHYASSLVDDLGLFRAVIRQNGNAMWWVGLTCFLILTSLLTIRALALPLLGWDTLTYHGVKAGIWVQARGWTSLIAPGGWEYYESFFGGGEMFTAWAMLFFHSDLLAGIPDVVFWGLAGLTLTCLAREFGMQARSAMLLSMAFLSSIELSRMVGSGYVDTCANAFLLGGILFLARFARSKRHADLYVAALAAGVASAVKVNMLAISILMALPVILYMIWWRLWSTKAFCLCLLAFAGPVAPWLLFNYVFTGYPLGAVPLRFGPMHLGAMPPNLAWFMDRPDLTPYVLAAEASAMLAALQPFGLALLLTGLGVMGMLLGMRRCRSELILSYLLMAVVGVLYFSPSFSVIRLGWAGVNGRFVLPILVLTAATGLPVLQRYRCGSLLIEGVSTAAIVTHMSLFMQSYVFWRHPVEILFLIMAILLTLIIVGASCMSKMGDSVRMTVTASLCVATIASTLYAFAQFKDAFRIEAYFTGTTLQGFPRYWVDGLRALESAIQPQRIAFTYGPHKVSHGAFLAPFLGGRFKHTLLYVSPHRDGAVVPHHPEHLAKSHPCFIAWTNGLRSADATLVLSLRPPGHELRWMQESTNLFVRLAGQVDDWGLFLVERHNP